VPQIGTLGYFWLRYDDKPIQLPPMQGKIITALHCNRGTHHQDALIDMVWEYPRRISPATFRTHISRIRRTIRWAGFDPDILFAAIQLAGDRNAYEIREEVQSDGDRAISLGNSGMEALVRGDVERAMNTLRQAAELWKPVTRQDQILAGVADLTFAIPAIRQLWEARRDALTKLAAAELHLGLDSKAAADLTRLAADWPEDREIARLQATALFSCGRLEEAADVCKSASAKARAACMDNRVFLDLHRDILNGTVPLRHLVSALPLPGSPIQPPTPRCRAHCAAKVRHLLAQGGARIIRRAPIAHVYVGRSTVVMT
jgi:DNA-binding SARP family transcriptional activator